ncbi:hypothetical protein AXJ14_gp191 [Geobacillus virus E3]|uniref:hypothetical protein n=1 Tax=Geobacillus virus E3 TaxID=1572712 RepID=UPI0006718CA0|nr:hypothetical protein AXJ14_gp191 [Geobacillus virus E3]AJA41510.1 hypothetical protein E3_0191 [Geobacillus virus E3]
MIYMMIKIQAKSEFLKPYYMGVNELKDMLAILEQKVGESVVIEKMTVIDYEYQYTNFHYTLEVITDAGTFKVFIDEIPDVDKYNTNIYVA